MSHPTVADNPPTANLRTQTMQMSDSTTEPRTGPHGVTLTPAAPSLPHSCRCGDRWAGNSTAHCPNCHLTFTVVSAFDKHRRAGECVHPTQVGLRLYGRTGYVAWGYPDSGRRDHDQDEP